MADEDDSQKTEEPSGKRLGEAQSKGQVVESQEVGNWFSLAAATLVVGMFGADIGHRLITSLAPFLASPHAIATAIDRAGISTPHAAIATPHDAVAAPEPALTASEIWTTNSCKNSFGRTPSVPPKPRRRQSHATRAATIRPAPLAETNS